MNSDEHREVTDLIAQYFNPQTRRILVCNECGWLVTWVTKHLKERHGMDIQIIDVEPEHKDGQQLW